jgi:5'-nucleotidase
MLNRRKFIQLSSACTAAFMLQNTPLQIFAADVNNKDVIKLCILHTNDWHSRIEPFPMDGSKWQGAGGAARRAWLINEIRKEEPNVLLLDAGDIFQGTPYFNFFHGELEYKLMSHMRYDAATLGNHDFDAGLNGIYSQLKHANFSFLCANYNFDNTILKGTFKPYKVFQKDKIKIGVFGLGIALEGLVPDNLFGNTKYLEPIPIANETAQHLKKNEKCDIVICLSHLGYKYDSNKISDIVLAQNTKNIDLIIGGHTHTFLDVPDIQKNVDGAEVLINQVGWAGINLGRIDFYFTKNKHKIASNYQTVIVGKNTRQ